MSDGFPANHLPKPTMPSNLLGEKSDHKKENRKKIWLSLEELQEGNYQEAKTDKEIQNKEKNVSIIKNALNYKTFTTDDSGAFTPYAEEERALTQRDVYCLINSKLFSQAELEQSLNFVAHMGYGKNSTIGKGFFEVNGCEEVELKPMSKTIFMTLSPSVLEGQNIQTSYYEPFTRFGKHGAELANKSPFKKPLLLANSGAVVVFENAYQKPYIGKAIRGHSTHPETVHQGYAIIIPLKERLTMQTYKLKLTALTPIHIGTGEVYEPTNFVIDNGYLYEFDEIKFYKLLDTKSKKVFMDVVSKESEASLFSLHGLIKQHKNEAIESSILKVQVFKSFTNEYELKIGKVVKIEGKTTIKNVFNRFQIERTSRLTNTHKVYIPASSIKGSISTAYQEYIFKKNYKKLDELFHNRRPQENIFKNLMISDTVPIKTMSVIGYSLNKERFEDDELGPSNRLEVIYTGSEFETTLQIRDYEVTQQVDFDLIRKSANAHYLPLFKSMLEEKVIHRGQKIDEYTSEYLSETFIKTYKDFTPKENQFLLRIGKYSGARSVTIEGQRQIKVKISGGGKYRKPNKWETLEEETTTWLFGNNEQATTNLFPFGWVLCEREEVF
ncbi:MAG: RAMP superfamily CRISPR-associated protein [Sulfuricurvum sp.]